MENNNSKPLKNSNDLKDLKKSTPNTAFMENLLDGANAKWKHPERLAERYFYLVSKNRGHRERTH